MLLASRAEDVAADGEHAAFLRFGGLEPSQLLRVRLERERMPAIDLDAISGIIVGGSPFDTSATHKGSVQQRVEREMAALLDEVVARDVPFLGACYGVGTLGVHQGGVIDRTYGEPIGAVPITLTDAGRADPLLAGMPATFDAFVGHKEACRVLPPAAVLLASSPMCPVQMFRVRENLYATQFHPELDTDGIVTRLTVYRENGYYPPHEIDDVIARVRAATVTQPHRLVSAFVRRYARS